MFLYFKVQSSRFVPRTYAAVFNFLNDVQLNLKTAQMKLNKIHRLPKILIFASIRSCAIEPLVPLLYLAGSIRFIETLVIIVLDISIFIVLHLHVTN